MSIRITCISKAAGDHENPYVAISKLGWVNLLNPTEKRSSTRMEMYEFVLKGGEAFVYDRTGTIRSKLICPELLDKRFDVIIKKLNDLKWTKSIIE
jgi:hypothetical protein